MKGERLVGGLRCSEVLAQLPNVLDGSIGAASRAMVEAHLGGCGVCAAFGGRYAASAGRMREALAAEPNEDAVARLAKKLLAVPEGGE